MFLPDHDAPINLAARQANVFELLVSQSKQRMPTASFLYVQISPAHHHQQSFE